MASNPYVNKVIYGDQTVMDISDTTANEGDVAEGKAFYKASGARSVGTGNYYSPSDTAETDLDDADYVPFYDTSESGKRKSLWSNIKAKLKTYFDTLYQTILTFDDAPKELSNNPVKSSGIYKTVQGTDVLVDKTVGYVKKNLLQIDSSVVSTTNNGITFTVFRNSDGEVESIRVTGETTDPSTEAVLDLGRFNLNFNTYILSGGLNEHIFLRLTEDGGFSVLEDKGEGAEFTLGFYADEYNHAYLVVSDYDIPWRFDVYPMIRYAEIGSNKFYPYNSKETVQKQLDNKVITLTKAEYDVLTAAEKNDPTKVYYVTDYDPVPVYAPLDDSTTAADKVWSSQKVDTQKADNSVIAHVENGATASRAYAIGEHFIKNGAFCTAKTAIASGATLTLNTNYTAGTIGENFGIYKSTKLPINTSKAGGAWQEILSLTLSKGIWIVNAIVSFDDSSSQGEKWVRLKSAVHDPYFRNGITTITRLTQSYTDLIDLRNANDFNLTLLAYVAGASNSIVLTSETNLEAVKIG